MSMELTIRARTFRVVPNGEGFDLAILTRTREWDWSARIGRDGRPIDYRIAESWVTLNSEPWTREEAVREARASWRMYPVSTRPFDRRRLPSSARPIG